jgi:hypothetical protein
MRLFLLCALLSLAACKPGPGGEDGGTGGGSGGSGGAGGSGGSGGGSSQPLGLNDVTVLVPLPVNELTPVLFKANDLALDGTQFVPDDLYQRVIKRPNDMPDVFTVLSDFHIVAVRFDLCDRQLPWPCEKVDDARLRIVFQPIFTGGKARDIALHGFYEVPNAEVPAAIEALRALAALQNAPVTSPLTVSPALAANRTGAYATALKELVKKYANTAALRRLTFFAQPDVFAQIRWVFRGLEGRPPNYGLISIAGINAFEQDVILEGGPSAPGYSATPFADDPVGLGRALDARAFDGGTAAERDAALHALTSVNNPTEHTPGTVQCVACHVATFLSAQRAKETGTSAVALPDRYQSAFDLSVDAGGSETSGRFLRALGWINDTPLISQRAVNETAQTLLEIQQRFP